MKYMVLAAALVAALVVVYPAAAGDPSNSVSVAIVDPAGTFQLAIRNDGSQTVNYKVQYPSIAKWSGPMPWHFHKVVVKVRYGSKVYTGTAYETDLKIGPHQTRLYPMPTSPRNHNWLVGINVIVGQTSISPSGLFQSGHFGVALFVSPSGKIVVHNYGSSTSPALYIAAVNANCAHQVVAPLAPGAERVVPLAAKSANGYWVVWLRDTECGVTPNASLTFVKPA